MAEQGYSVDTCAVEIASLQLFTTNFHHFLMWPDQHRKASRANGMTSPWCRKAAAAPGCTVNTSDRLSWENNMGVICRVGHGRRDIHDLISIMPCSASNMLVTICLDGSLNVSQIMHVDVSNSVFWWRGLIPYEDGTFWRVWAFIPVASNLPAKLTAA